jgi:hypothetical protein
VTDGWNRNSFSMFADIEEVKFARTMKELMHDAIYRPWRLSDPNPMPHLDWWPWVDTAMEAPSEARRRLRGAWRVLRHGDVCPDCGEAL